MTRKIGVDLVVNGAPVSRRRMIILRALRGLGVMTVSASMTAIASDDFRDFVGDDTLVAVLAGAAVPALLAVDKWLRSRR